MTTDDLELLLDILADPAMMVSVAPEEAVIVTDDGCTMSFYKAQSSSSVGIPLSRLQAILTHERACAADTTSLNYWTFRFRRSNFFSPSSHLQDSDRRLWL